MNEQTTVRAWVEDVILPTYLVGEPNRNPMFLEKRLFGKPSCFWLERGD